MNVSPYLMRSHHPTRRFNVKDAIDGTSSPGLASTQASRLGAATAGQRRSWAATGHLAATPAVPAAELVAPLFHPAPDPVAVVTAERTAA